MGQFDAKQPVRVTILDLNKKVVASQTASAGVVKVSTAGIPAGFYIVVISNGHNVITNKIVIQ
jgi:hypothetical protein